MVVLAGRSFVAAWVIAKRFIIPESTMLLLVCIIGGQTFSPSPPFFFCFS
jgi:hypothetical protein